MVIAILRYITITDYGCWMKLDTEFVRQRTLCTRMPWMCILLHSSLSQARSSPRTPAGSQPGPEDSALGGPADRGDHTQVR